MEPVVIILLYFLAIYGISIGQWTLVAAAALIAFFSARDYATTFIISLAVIWGARLFIPETATWGAVALAIATLSMMLGGLLGERKKKKEEEIPPELLPYLMAMYGSGGARY
jgi:predicted membrane protein